MSAGLFNFYNFQKLTEFENSSSVRPQFFLLYLYLYNYHHNYLHKLLYPYSAWEQFNRLCKCMTWFKRGDIFSNFETSLKASKASSSVADVYLARFVSFKKQCSGEIQHNLNQRYSSLLILFVHHCLGLHTVQPRVKRQF